MRISDWSSDVCSSDLLAERRQDAATAQLAEARSRIEIVDPLAVSLPSAGLPASRTVLDLYPVTAAHVAGRPVIRDLSLTLTGPERVAIVCPNGAGQSTLLPLAPVTLSPWPARPRHHRTRSCGETVLSVWY